MVIGQQTPGVEKRQNRINGLYDYKKSAPQIKRFSNLDYRQGLVGG